MGVQPVSAVSREEQAEESQYDLLAQSVRENLDMELVYRAMDKKV